MAQREVYTYTFQFISPSTGEIKHLDEMRMPQTPKQATETFAAVTDWLFDHPERRCVITRTNSEEVIDLTHHSLAKL